MYVPVQAVGSREKSGGGWGRGLLLQRVVVIQEGREGLSRIEGRVVGDEQPGVLLGQERKHRLKSRAIAVVPDDVLAVLARDGKTVGPAGKTRIVREVLAVHVEGSALPQDACTAIFAVLQVRQHKPGHVGSRRVHRRRRCVGDPLEVLGVVGSVFVVIALGQIGGQAAGSGWVAALCSMPSGFEDVVGDVLLVGLARDPLDDVTGERRAVVGVAEYSPGG